ncbi:unnamed protein product [Bemisia tabaci]|uniref:Myb-like domain-containing protein n=1 Tax=Bemisia tabaci TaxID=7038 RepID=A0A9P0G2W9_BEMTA|nr:unnamed protein product [Bemisia tabaci]
MENEPPNAEKSEEVLGSVTHCYDIENGDKTGSVQLRTSARVSKKMRLDSTAAAVPPPTADIKDTKDETKTPEPKPKIRRAPELWSTEDKNLFFEALNEYGKDFDAIQNYMLSKSKKRGVGDHVAKNRDQARHFYHRTWHKISKHLKFPEGIKKPTQELYALINFGEIRKKIGFLSEKNSSKLIELIYTGSTKIRIKGKTWRIKTPPCRALRKLNQLEESSEDFKLPTKICVELVPRDNSTWLSVQSIAMNPRVRANVSLHNRLATLIEYLQQKWKSPHLKLRDKIINSSQVNASDYEISEPDSILRVAPKPNTNIFHPSFRINEFIPSSKISLLRHEQQFGTTGESISSLLEQLKSKQLKPGKNAVKRQRADSASDKVSTLQPISSTSTAVPTTSASSIMTPKTAAEPELISENNNKPVPILEDEIVQCAVDNLLSFKSENEKKSSENETSPDKTDGKSGSITGDWTSPNKDEHPEELDHEVDETSGDQEKHEDFVRRISKGWTQHNAESIRIGDLYLMFGSDSKIHLEYWWEEAPKVSVNSPKENGTSTEITNVATSSDCPNSSKTACKSNPPSLSKEPESKASSSVSSVLQKLVCIAKLSLLKPKAECTCGHVCGGPNQNKSSAKNKASSKVQKNDLNEKSTSNHSAVILNGVNSAIGSTVSVSTTEVFRKPTLVPIEARPNQDPTPSSVQAFKAQLDKFCPRFSNRRGRAGNRLKNSNNLVVQRMLPLLPKTSPLGNHSVVTMRVLPQSNQLAGDFAPINKTSQPKLILPKQEHPVKILPKPAKPPTTVSMQPTSVSVLNLMGQPVSQVEGSKPCDPIIGVDQPNRQSDDDPSLLLNDLSNLSTLMRSIPPSDLSLNSSTFEGLLSNNNGPQAEPGLSQETPLSSPTRLLKDDENNWLSSEVGDFSFSSFLGHLESSPMKSSSNNEESKLMSDVEAQLQCLMSENSVDYTAKFADLAAQIAADTKK